ncbi:TRAP transporter small permease subunit [Azospirillum melinis]
MLSPLYTSARFIARTLAQVGFLLLLAFAAATLIDGLSRGLFHRPIDGVRDLGDMIVAVAVSCCFPQAFLGKQNIAIAFIGTIVGRRLDLAIDLFVALAVAVVTGLFAWQFIVHAGTLVESSEVSPLMGVPKAPFWYVVAANMTITFFMQIVVCIGEIQVLLAERRMSNTIPAALRTAAGSPHHH